MRPVGCGHRAGGTCPRRPERSSKAGEPLADVQRHLRGTAALARTGPRSR